LGVVPHHEGVIRVGRPRAVNVPTWDWITRTIYFAKKEMIFVVRSPLLYDVVSRSTRYYHPLYNLIWSIRVGLAIDNRNVTRTRIIGDKTPDNIIALLQFVLKAVGCKNVDQTLWELAMRDGTYLSSRGVELAHVSHIPDRLSQTVKKIQL